MIIEGIHTTYILNIFGEFKIIFSVKYYSVLSDHRLRIENYNSLKYSSL